MDGIRMMIWDRRFANIEKRESMIMVSTAVVDVTAFLFTTPTKMANKI